MSLLDTTVLTDRFGSVLRPAAPGPRGCVVIEVCVVCGLPLSECECCSC